jgi:hypothetical protein
MSSALLLVLSAQTNETRRFRKYTRKSKQREEKDDTKQEGILQRLGRSGNFSLLVLLKPISIPSFLTVSSVFLLSFYK